MNRNDRLQDTPAYLHGQILAMQAVLFALASITTDKQQFRATAQQRLEMLRTAVLPEAVPEVTIAGIDQVAALLDGLTE